MTSLGKYMRARPVAKAGKTKAWTILSRDDFTLGKVAWYAPWRQYVFSPAGNTLFNATCLTELRTFLSAETTKQLHPSVVYDEIDAVAIGAEVRALGLTGEGEGNY